MKCNHINRIPVAINRGQCVIGGISVGTCPNETYPGLVCCFEHADKNTLDMLIQHILHDYKRATGKDHPYAAHFKNRHKKAG